MIEQLTVLSPDPARSARTLERCRQRLAPRPRRQLAERAAFAGFCALYLAAIALNAARVLIPIALSAVFVFLASSIIHMATPWHKNDLDLVPNEDGVMNALRPFNIPPGDYGMPKASSRKDMQSPEFLAKFKAGPVAFMTVRPSGEMSMSRSLILWFLYSLVVSMVAGYIAGVAFGPGAEYLRIFQVAGCVAFTGYALGQAHESIWWGRKWSRTFRNMLDGLLYGLLTGGTFGWLWPR